MDTMMIRHLARLLAYDDWANCETLASLRAAGAPPSRSLKLMAHVIAAEWLWLNRLKRERQAMAVWPELTVGECELQLAELPRVWKDYLAGLTPVQLSQPVTYTNTKGESWTNAVHDILTHVVLHSAYHRGQIASDLRAAGHTPAYTDFIHGVRQGLVE